MDKKEIVVVEQENLTSKTRKVAVPAKKSFFEKAKEWVKEHEGEIIISCIGVLVTAVSASIAYEKGHKDGDSSGYVDGISDGVNFGYHHGYEDGSDDGYDAGYDDGFNDGLW